MKESAWFADAHLGWGGALTLCFALGLQGQANVPAVSSAPGARPVNRALGAFPLETPRHLGAAVRELITEPKVARAHWGVAVAAMDGQPVYGLNEGQFFQPASTTKLFTTAAAMGLLGPEGRVETRVLTGDLSEAANTANSSARQGDLLLVGGGDAYLSGTELPYVVPVPRAKGAAAVPEPIKPEPLRYLEAMADQVAARGVKVIPGDVIGDDTIWPWEPYPQDWAIDDAVWGYGAPVSALSVADNLLKLTVTPGAKPGDSAAISLEQAVPYYTIQARVLTAAAQQPGLGIDVEREPGSRVLRVDGRIAANAPAEVQEIAIADPAEYAAMAFKSMLESRGVPVRGRARALHRQYAEEHGLLRQAREALPLEGGSGAVPKRGDPGASYDLGCVSDCALRGHVGMSVVASHESPPLIEDVVLTNKLSQNLHAELMLRRLGAAMGDAGTAAQGARVVRSFLVAAGVDPEDFVFYDGSGLSGHDLVTPRATVRLLTWASGQPWFDAWRASLPVGGVDGTLMSRFARGLLKGKVFAKTGTMGEARALAGYVVCASGRMVAFAVMDTSHAPGSSDDREVMDRIIEAIAAAD